MTREQRATPLVLLVLLMTAGGDSGASPRSPVSAAKSARPSAPSGPTIVVEATYPGANSQIVADTVATPIEQQINGVENLVDMTSRSSNEGAYTLTVRFKPGTDLNSAQVLVQNRVALALPVLPEEVKQSGVTVRKKSPTVLLIVTLSSPGGRFDSRYLANYARVQIRDDLSRVIGVADVRLGGEQDLSLHIWLDPIKLAACDLSPLDVVRALEKKHGKVSSDKQDGAKKNDFQFSMRLGHIADPAALAEVLLKTDDSGRTIRLKDVARLRIGGDPPAVIRFNGESAVPLWVYSIPQVRAREVSSAVRKKLDQLRDRLPEGLRLEVAFDFSGLGIPAERPATDEYLVLDVTLPDDASLNRTEKVLSHCSRILRGEPRVKDVLEVVGTPLAPFSNQGCIVVRLAAGAKAQAGREDVERIIRGQLEKEISGATIRLRALTGMGRQPLGSYPIDLAVHGPEPDQVRKLAEKLAEQLRRSKKLTDVWICRAALPSPQLFFDVNRAQAKKQGVALRDIIETLQACLHGQKVDGFAPPYRVIIQADPQFREQINDLKRLKVRNDKGAMVALDALVNFRMLENPRIVDRYNLEPMLQLTANPAADVPLAQARKLCEVLADQVRKELQLSAEYRLSWLTE